MKNCFGIIGGMGIMVMEDFVYIVNWLIVIYCDQDYLNYVILNDVEILDCIVYILDYNCVNLLLLLEVDVQLFN